MMKKNGFTLAEILVTMGVLGVIAAMTLPALMTNINSSTWTAGLRTNMGVISNGFAEMMAVENADSLDDTKLWGEIITEDINTANDDVKNELGKYFKIDKMESGIPSGYPVYTLQMAASSDMDSTIRFYLANSATMNIVFHASSLNENCSTIKANGGSMCENYADIYLDINGNKRPNIFGHDIFKFYLSREGKIYPYGGKDANLFDNNNPLWDTDGCPGKTPSTDGLACTARIIDEGFKITYDK